VSIFWENAGWPTKTMPIIVAAEKEWEKRIEMFLLIDKRCKKRK